jgi:hypothetical protein
MGYSTITSDGDGVEYGLELEYDVLAGAVDLGPGSREARNDAERPAAPASQPAALTDYLDDRVQLFLDGARCEFALAGTSVGEREAVPYASSSASSPAGILVGHPHPQRPQRVVRLRLHRPGCAPEHVRDLLLGQVLVEPQHHHRPLPRRLARQVFPQANPVQHPRLVRGTTGCRNPMGGGVVAFPFPAPLRGDEAVDQHLVQIRLRRIRPLHSSPGRIRL